MKKGYTVIELIYVMALLMVLFIFEENYLYKSVINYSRSIKSDRGDLYSMEALRFIESEITDFNNSTVKIDKDKITIKKDNGDKNIIKTNNSKTKIVIKYLRQYKGETTDTIVDNISNFEVLKKGNVVFVFIEYYRGKKYEKCIGIREKKGI